MSHPHPENEPVRIAALNALAILDTPAETRFDRLTRLAGLTFRAPIALVSLVDTDRQWFKSRCGLDTPEMPRSIAFCSHAVALREMLVIEDASIDPRFASNPLVMGEPHIRFYAGQPVYSNAEPVGTLCILDTVPRCFDDVGRQTLRDLARLVEVELNLVTEQTKRLLAEQALKALNADLERQVINRTRDLEDTVARMAREIDRRNLAEAALQRSECWNQTIVASSYSGFIGTNEDGVIVEWNASAGRIFGWTRAQAIGQKLGELIIPGYLHASRDKSTPPFGASCTETAVARKIDMPALTANGCQIMVEMTISAYDWQGHRCLGAFVNDISERIRNGQQLEEKQELLNAVLESIDVAVVACDAVGNLTLFNRAAQIAHGLDLKAIAPSEWSRYYSLYQGDGRTPLAMDNIPLVRALKGDIVRDQTMVIAPKGMPVRTMLASGRMLRSASGRPLGAVAVMKDITELSVSREQLAMSERMLRTITDNVPVLIACLDGERRYTFANAVHASWLGKPAERILGQTMEEAFGREYHADQVAALAHAWQGQMSQCEHEIVRKNHTRIVHSTFLPQVHNDVVTGVFVLTTDATASRQHERNLHALAHTDALTSLPNRRHFEAALNAAAGKRRESGHHVALLYLDIDHFKQINDTYGHANGDAALVEFARRLQTVVRGPDVVARLAGDEFTVLLQDVRSEADVELIMRKILAAVWSPFVLTDCTIDVGTTIGAAMSGGLMVTPALLMESADAALYTAKKGGRNTYAIRNLCISSKTSARLANTQSLAAL